MKILVINGVNMNMLGFRETEKYGSMTLKDLEKDLYTYSFKLGVDIETFQSNFEGEIVGIVINAGAYTHTSVAIRDAISAVNLPTVEVHMTNIYKREEFRHHSYLAPVCIGQISGFSVNSYKLGLNAIVNSIKSTTNE